VTEAVEQLKSQIITLSGSERAELAHFLLSSLDPEEEEGAHEAWSEELVRRVAEIRDGSAVGRSADDVLAGLRHRCP
jgi:putative addiction module component (TIGR02574 family)